MDLVRRHRRLVGVAVFLFIGLPMLFLFPGASGLGGPMGGPAEMPVAMAGNTPVTAQEFAFAYNQAADERRRRGQSADPQSMVNDGTVDQILDTLIQDALIAEQTKDARVLPNQAYLEKQFRKNALFQNENGEFDPGRYNQWVEARKASGFDWSSLFDDLRHNANRTAYMQLVGASGRVLEREVREQFDRLNTKLSVRAVPITPPVEWTEEDLAQYFEENRDSYMTPEERVAEFIAISLEPDMSEMNAIIERARGGADFVAMVEDYSVAPDAEEGGDLGWVNENETLRAYEEPLFDMEIGEIRGPISSFMGKHVLKLEEERVNDAGEREVRGRHIVMRPELSEEERAARIAEAEELVAQVREDDSLELLVLAADAGLEVQQTAPFSNQSRTIENVPDRDMFPFRSAVLNLPIGVVSEVIEGQENVYLAEVTEIIAPRQQTFEEARATVEQQYEREQKQTAEYQQRVADMIVQISDNAESVDDITGLYPDMEWEIKETDPFGFQDSLFNQQLFIDTRQLFARFVDAPPGEFAGPINDLLQTPHFIELVSVERPEGEEWDTQYANERDDIRMQLAAERELAHRVDHMQFLMSQAIEDAMIQKDYDLVFEIIGLGETAGAPVAEPETMPAPEPEQESTKASEEAVPIMLEETTAPAESDDAGSTE